MISRTDRAHSGSASAMRDRERLVQVEVAYVSADLGGRRQADLRIHVRAIHVDLAAGFVDSRADLAYGFLEYTMRRGVGDHQGAELIVMFFDALAQIRDVDIAPIVTFHCDATKAGDDGARSVRSVGGDRDEADIPGSLAL